MNPAALAVGSAAQIAAVYAASRLVGAPLSLARSAGIAIISGVVGTLVVVAVAVAAGKIAATREVKAP